MMKRYVERFLRETGGSSSVEYGILAAICGIGVIAAATLIKDSFNSFYLRIVGGIPI